MSHENGIKAAAQKYYEFCHGTDYAPELDVAEIIKAYLDSSDMCIVPREPTDDIMIGMECVASGLMSFASKEESPSYRAYLAALYSFPDPFHQGDVK